MNFLWSVLPKALGGPSSYSWAETELLENKDLHVYSF